MLQRWAANAAINMDLDTGQDERLGEEGWRGCGRQRPGRFRTLQAPPPEPHEGI